MQINVIMQKENENTIASAISSCLEKNAKKAYFFVGNFKETGYKIIEEDLIDIKTKLFFAIGIDKKTTTKSMLEGLLDYTDDVYYYSNNNINEYVSNICIFEYSDSVEMYICTSNLSESGIQTDLSLYTKIVYNLKDAKEKQDYKNQIKELLKIVELDGFNKLNKQAISNLVEQKEIFTTRQYNHNVMSISELLGKKPKANDNGNKEKLSKEEIDDVYAKDVQIPKIDLSDISLDIDIPTEEIAKDAKKEEIAIDYEEEKITLPKDIESYEEVKKEEKKESKIDKNNELYDESMESEDIDLNKTLDINNMLFSKADIKLDITEEKKPKKRATKKESKKIEDEEVVKVKKVNLNNVTNLIFELPDKNSKEPDSIRVQNYIKTMIPAFFGLDDAENEEINGTLYKVKNIELEIVDVKENQRYEDKEAKITYKPKQSYLTFNSSYLSNVMYKENDIVRIIKLSENVYHVEVIDKGMQEYKVWKKLCNQNLKASEKKFGVM